MPINQSSETEAGTLDSAPLQETALSEVAMTTLPAGMDAIPMTVTVNYFRPPRPQTGNLLARARVVNSSRFFVFTEVEIEDPHGRRIARGSSHLRLRRVEPAPPPVPLDLLPAEEPIYAIPDPYLRQPIGKMPPLTTWQENDGDVVMRMFADRTFVAPYQLVMPVEYSGGRDRAYRRHASRQRVALPIFAIGGVRPNRISRQSCGLVRLSYHGSPGSVARGA